MRREADRISSITNELRDIMVNQYYNLCRMHCRKKFILEDIFATGEYDEDIENLNLEEPIAIELNVDDSKKLMMLNEMAKTHYDLLYTGTSFKEKVIGDKIKDDMER